MTDTGEVIKLIINGKPMGKERPRMTKTGHVYTPQATRNYETMVAGIARKEMEVQKWGYTEEAIGRYVEAFFPIPKSKTKRWKEKALAGQVRPTTKPDDDNILKITSDPCNKILFKDDSQIVDSRIVLYYSEEPRVEVTFFRL